MVVGDGGRLSVVVGVVVEEEGLHLAVVVLGGVWEIVLVHHCCNTRCWGGGDWGCNSISEDGGISTFKGKCVGGGSWREGRVKVED